MTREEFMNMVYSELHSDGDNYRANRIIDAADEYADEYAAEQTRWIPVSERLPEYSGNYLITIVDKDGRYFEIISWFYPSDHVWSFRNVNVIAWMPLSEPYNAEGMDKE